MRRLWKWILGGPKEHLEEGPNWKEKGTRGWRENQSRGINLMSQVLPACATEPQTVGTRIS